MWEANSRLENSYRVIDAPTVKWTEVAVAGTQQKAQVLRYAIKWHLKKIQCVSYSSWIEGKNKKIIFKVMLYLPPGYQSGSKLPMLVEVYGGPGFQKVLCFALCICNHMKYIYSSILLLIENGQFIWYSRLTSSGKGIAGRPMWQAPWALSTQL